MNKLRVLFVSAAVVFLMAGPARGQQYVSDFEKRLAGAEDEIKAMRARLDAESRKEATVLSALARLNLSRDLLKAELAARAIKVEKAEVELKEHGTRMSEIETQLDREREQVERILAAIYKYGKPDFAAFLLRAGDFAAMAAETKRLSFLAGYERRIILDFNASLARLQEARLTLESKTRDLTEQQRLAEIKRKELEEETKKNADLVLQIKQNKATYNKTLGELQDGAAQLQVLMKKIATNEWVLTSRFVPISDRHGRLAWPVGGKIITRFGPEVHPRFKTTIMNKGIDIAPSGKSVPVQAVHAGKVVYADYFYGYGNLLIIDHGLTYYSLYGHCSEFLVKLGDMIEAGRKIALTGDTGSLKGECLYFEIRYKSQAVDPLKWLQKK